MSLLEFRNVTYIHSNNSILENISLNIEQGDFVSITGPSGSGKSTILKLCSNLISPTEGDILFKAINLNLYAPTELRKSITYCFQTPYLFGDTVIENIRFPFLIRDLQIDDVRVNELFSKFQMPIEFLAKEVKNLSGGEKQRLSLIRSLLFKPEILLLDEITAALDVENTKIVEKVIKSLNNEGITVLWVTHNTEQSRKLANKRITVENGRVKNIELLG